MLVLTRFPGQSIYIGDAVKVTILGRVGNQIRVGVLAPREISVDRDELYTSPNKDKYRVRQKTEQFNIEKND